MFAIPLLVSKCDNKKEIIIVNYKGKLVITYMDEKHSLMELQVMKSFNRREWHKRYMVKISAIMRKTSHISPFAFHNTNTVVMRGYFYDVMLFNFKTGSIDMMQLGNGLFHLLFPFQTNFNMENKWQKYWWMLRKHKSCLESWPKKGCCIDNPFVIEFCYSCF